MKCIHAKMSLRCPFVQRSGAVQRTGPILYGLDLVINLLDIKLTAYLLVPVV